MCKPPPVQRLDGKQDRWAPRYLCVAQPLVPFTYYSEGFKVKLSDMGGGESLPFQVMFPFFMTRNLYSYSYPKQHISLPSRRRSPLLHSAFELPSWFLPELSTIPLTTGVSAASSLNLSWDSSSSAYQGLSLKMTIIFSPSPPGSAPCQMVSSSIGKCLRCILRQRGSSSIVSLEESPRERNRLCWRRSRWRNCSTTPARILVIMRPVR